MEHTKEKWEIDGRIGGQYVVYLVAGKKIIATLHTLEDGKDNKARLRESEANANLIVAAPDMFSASEDFIKGWGHFCDCIDFGNSNLDSEAIRFMNEVPGKIEQANIKARNK